MFRLKNNVSEMKVVFAQSDGWRYETLRILKNKLISPLSR